MISFTVYRGSPSGKITPTTTTRPQEPHQVHIETTHSGLCGTDEHYLHAGCVLGHEGIGIIKQLGTHASMINPALKIGSRVGFAYLRSVCGTCENCTSGRDQYC